MNPMLCQTCGELVESKPPVDVPAGITLCGRCVAKHTFECDRCHRTIASPDIEGGELLEDAPVLDEIWCRTCCKEHAAYCDACGSNYLVDQLTSTPKGLVCDRCQRRQKRIDAGRAKPLSGTNIHKIVRRAIRSLPAEVRGAVEQDSNWGEESRIRIKAEIVVGHEDTDNISADISVRRTSMPDDFFWPTDTNIVVSESKVTESRYAPELFVVAGATAGVNFLDGDRAYDVDLEQAVRRMILEELYHFGLVSRDEYGRFFDGRGHQILP